MVEQDATYLSNARHISLIEKAVESLQAVNEGLELGMPVDLLQVDLTRTWEILGEITGDAAPDELITQLFSQFCLGKYIYIKRSFYEIPYTTRTFFNLCQG